MFYSQITSTCPFATFSPVGWLASDCTQKSSPADQMICCSHVQPARTGDLKGACVCTTGLVNHSLLLPWLEITPFLSYVVPWMKKKVLQWPDQLVRTTSNSFFSYAESNGQSSELRCDAESCICSTGPRRDFWSYVHYMRTFVAYHCTAILPIVGKVRGHSGSVLPKYLTSW